MLAALCHHAATALSTPVTPTAKPIPTQLPSIQPKAPPEHLRVVEDFLEADVAGELRGCFDEHFAEPRQAHPMRFVWDYWHVPGQYTLHRTQAANYFEPEDFEALTTALTDYGQQTLGCRTISPPWLSFYIDGCEQQVHADVPQGPLAYVLSLTRWDERSFTGGETTIMQPNVLDYWCAPLLELSCDPVCAIGCSPVHSSCPPYACRRDFDSTSGLERPDLFEDVPARFNQLTVFDARLPHGVRRVEGVRDPRGARLVLHGWFTEPEPHFEGGLDGDAVSEGLQPSMGRISDEMPQPPVVGLLSVRLHVSPSGAVERLERLADTLVADPAQLEGESPAEARRRALGVIGEALQAASFAPCDEETRITLPLVFD